MALLKHTSPMGRICGTMRSMKFMFATSMVENISVRSSGQSSDTASTGQLNLKRSMHQARKRKREYEYPVLMTKGYGRRSVPGLRPTRTVAGSCTAQLYILSTRVLLLRCVDRSTSTTFLVWRRKACTGTVRWGSQVVSVSTRRDGKNPVKTVAFMKV